MGRAEAEITPWLEYFVHGMVISWKCLKHMEEAREDGDKDQVSLSQTRS